MMHLMLKSARSGPSWKRQASPPEPSTSTWKLLSKPTPQETDYNTSMNNTMTYQELLEQLQSLTPEQLAQTVTIHAEDLIWPDKLRTDEEDGQLYFLATVC